MSPIPDLRRLSRICGHHLLDERFQNQLKRFFPFGTHTQSIVVISSSELAERRTYGRYWTSHPQGATIVPVGICSMWRWSRTFHLSNYRVLVSQAWGGFILIGSAFPDSVGRLSCQIQRRSSRDGWRKRSRVRRSGTPSIGLVAVQDAEERMGLRNSCS